jgi:hypothetical protein
MHRPLNLSSSIVNKVPAERRYHTVANIEWVLKNAHLSMLELREALQALDDMRDNEDHGL